MPTPQLEQDRALTRKSLDGRSDPHDQSVMGTGIVPGFSGEIARRSHAERVGGQALLLACAFAALTGCGRRPAEKTNGAAAYETVPAQHRDISVSVEAAGVIQPKLTVDVKSKASGEILKMPVDVGDRVKKGALLVQIDKRTPHNNLAQAESELEAAKAQRSVAESQASRAKALLASRTMNQADYEQAMLNLANARSAVVRAQVAMENARIELEDTEVKSPITGTIIGKLAEKGQVISSPTRDVGGGTLLLKMADLSSVEVQALVDETDIGKIHPDQKAIVTVTAYPNQPFEGRVLKIEPQAQVDQTVTRFPVLIMLQNEDRLLKPGMNADIDIRVAEARDVLAIPTMALRTQSDITMGARMVGLPEAEVRKQLATPAGASDKEAQTREASPAAELGNGAGAESGSTEEGGYKFSSDYWVFVMRGAEPVAVPVTTGITDLDYSAIRSGLKDGDRVLLLPSSGLMEARERINAQIRRFTSMPGMGGDKAKKDGD